MKSAYQALGIDPTASPQDVEEAFQRIQAVQTPERLRDVDGAIEQLQQARTAYQVLRDPETRAAHDRKLAAAAPVAAARRPAHTTITQTDATSPLARFLWIGMAVVLLLFATGGYISMRNADRRAEAAAADRAAAEIRAKEEKERLDQAARDDDRRRADAARAEAAERRLTAESRVIAAEQNYRNARVETSVAQARRQEALQREAQLAADERRQHNDAQRRIESDRRRVVELCLQNYGRPNC